MKFIKKFILYLFLLICSVTAHAQNNFESTAFATIPIQSDGRIKPIDSFARAHLKILSGQESLAGLSATDWLIEALFDPVRASERPVIKIRNPELLQMLSLPKETLYSFAQIMEKMIAQRSVIMSIMNTPQDQWTQNQNDLITLQQKLAIFEQIMGSLSSILPLALDIPQDAPDYLKPFAGKTITYRDILKFREKIDRDLKSIIKTKGEKIENYTPQEQLIALISFTADQLRQKNQNNTILRVLPSSTAQSEWQSHWSLLSSAGNPTAAPLIALWQELSTAYHTSNASLWRDSAEKLRTATTAQGGDINHHIIIEYTYNLLHLHETSMGFYILALILTCAGIFLRWPRLITVSGGVLWIGVAFHMCGLGMRIYILGRPPVSTLYETTLFVGIIFVLYGLILWARHKNIPALIGAGVGGIILHLISFSHAGESDSMVMLEAVLNTKFWLATHVLCITTGYGFCLVTGAIAHYMLACHALRKPIEANLHSSLMTAGLLSLFFAATGTVLGGIWADQSWGRFWGWDPKENGAMLIVLWLIWVLHGRISGQIRPLAFLAGMAYLCVIVALSWFGVNLLSVGLHAYGFTDSLAWGLGVFVAAETLLIALLWRRAHAG